ncbi:hypothetical protein GO730_00190 [Spirosoma sp. HMF3257]|uniref:DUF2158 domain-containing protein n=1 Tax=Spirosoma telluris TaxID=2183553 RepID=A0A327NDC9_9BACT|nr:hypothetical protein [Spirosoma telluris]RAI73227.1 hypothetical protein HMF3257_00190 [Spirosoma telluris]
MRKIQPMRPVISPGDRVSVEIRIGGCYRGTQKGTVLYWTASGRISVKLDGKGEVKNVSPEQVKKLANGLS